MATPQFQLPLTNPFGLTNVGTFSNPTFVDIEGDGDLDAFVGVAFVGVAFAVAEKSNIYYYQNTGTATDPSFAAPEINPFGLANVGSFSIPPFSLINVGTFSSPTFVDINNDGDLDAFVGAWDGNTYYYENTGTKFIPSFASLVPPLTNHFGLTNVGSFNSPSFVNLDGDLLNLPDAVVGANDGNLYYYKNIGTVGSPTFAAPVTLTDPLGVPINVGKDSNPTFVNFDGDGDQDVVVGAYDGNIYYYENTGTATSPAFAAPVATNPFGLIGLSNVANFSSPTFVDIDGDGKLDAFVGASDGNIYYYKNDEPNAPPVNSPPTALLFNNSLTNTSIDENVLEGTVVSSFLTTDPDGDTSFTYQLVSGIGDTNNAVFSIVDQYLKINISPDYETKPSYSIRVQTTDPWGGSFQQELTIGINDLPEGPNINGTPRNNILRGTPSGELIQGLAGNDRIYGNAGNDRIYGNAGNDILYGGAGNDILYGNAGNDILYGNAGNDSLIGGESNDYLYAGEGDNLLNGGQGSDRLYGGTGIDTFVLETGMGSDFIYSFQPGQDKIQLAGGLTFSDLNLVDMTNSTMIKVRATGESLAMLSGTKLADVLPGDFTVGI
jgi:Ca2+-binding RTX toxin-like protein